MKGSLEVICGPMFCGKSEELIRRIKRAQIAKQKVVAFKHYSDDRYHENNIASHSGINIEAIPLNLSDYLPEIYNDKEGEYPEVVAIDEIQFFDEWVFPTINHWIENGVRVIVAGLDQDFRGNGFGIMPELLAWADRVDKLTAVCQVCRKDANMTQRLLNGNPAPFDGETVIVGADEQYEARCRDCHEEG